MRPTKFAEGSGGENLRVESACVRAIDAYMSLSRKADRLCEALDEATAPGVVVHEMDEEDSLVISIRDLIDHGTVGDMTNSDSGPARNPK